MDMALTVNMVEAKECGEQDAESLQKSSSVNRLSDYKKAQGSGLRDNQVEADVKFENRAASGDDVCRYCCRTGHVSGSSPEVREKLCPAYGKICGNCGKMDHFKQACRKEKKVAVDGEVRALSKEKEREEQLLIDTKIDEGGAFIDAKLDEGGVLIDSKIDEGGVLIVAKLDEGGALIDSKIDEGGTRGGALHPGPALQGFICCIPAGVHTLNKQLKYTGLANLLVLAP